MRILVVASEFPTDINEIAQSFVYDEVIRLAKQDIEIHVATSKIAKIQKLDKIYYHGLKYDILHHLPLLLAEMFVRGELFRLLRTPKLAPYGSLYAAHIYKVLKQIKPNLIHAHFAFPEGWVAYVAKRRYGNVPLIVTVHGYDINVLQNIGYGLLYHQNMKEIVKKVFTHSDLIIVVAKDMIEKVKQLGGNNIIYLPNGVDTSIFTPHLNIQDREYIEKLRDKLGIHDKILIGNFRHVKPQYGYFYIPYIAKILKKLGYYNFKIILAGDAPRPFLLHFSKVLHDLDVKDIVTYLGVIPRLQMPILYKAIDIYINTSLTDGTPPSVLEAMASGKPVISFAVGGNKDIIKDGINGFLVPPGDVRLFVERLAYFLKYPNEIKKFGADARKIIEENYDINIKIRKLLKIYEIFAQNG